MAQIDPPIGNVAPVGWQSAVAMLRAGVPRASILRGLQEELDLEVDDAEAAVGFASAWLAAARQA